MSRLHTLPGRLPAAAARLSRPEGPRSVAEALYEEPLGDDAGSMLCELLDLQPNRTGHNSARHATFYVAIMNRWVRQRCLVLDTELACRMD